MRNIAVVPQIFVDPYDEQQDEFSETISPATSMKYKSAGPLSQEHVKLVSNQSAKGSPYNSDMSK